MAELDNVASSARSRRNFVKAAGVAFGALFALVGKPKSSSAQHGDGHEHGHGHGGDDNACFLRGTKIRTNSGYRNVEDLTVGEMLPTVFGSVSPVQWIRSHGFKKNGLNKPWPRKAKPVRIMRSAIDDNVPDSDLYLTAAHSLLIDGALVPVGNLINGTTITLDDAGDFDVLEYFHIKLESHDAIDAQGASCETLLEVDGKDDIHKYGTSKTRQTPCAPVLGFSGGRSEVKSRLRSAVSYWVDRRQPLDVIRDRLEERGLALCRNMTPTERGVVGQVTVRVLRWCTIA
jgi:hypothetical protein